MKITDSWLRGQILILMSEIETNSSDTLWLTDLETIFERLSFMFVSSGGDIKILEKTWPHYFNGEIE